MSQLLSFALNKARSPISPSRETANLRLEKRQSARYDLDRYVSAYDAKAVKVGHLVDISVGGISLIGKQPLTPGNEIALRLTNIIETQAQREFIDVSTIVRWVAQRKATGLYVAGIEFHSLDVKARMRIGKLINSLCVD
ncbi:MAG: PilZ domain-containing protein [Lysobacterales bacterium]